MAVRVTLLELKVNHDINSNSSPWSIKSSFLAPHDFSGVISPFFLPPPASPTLASLIFAIAEDLFLLRIFTLADPHPGMLKFQKSAALLILLWSLFKCPLLIHVEGQALLTFHAPIFYFTSWHLSLLDNIICPS